MFCIKLAELVVEIDNRFAFVEKQCRDYLCPYAEGKPAFRVRVGAEEVATYRAETVRPLTDGEAESFLIYRKICGEMPRFGAYLLHASVVEMDGRGYAFSARRGVGKSTHTANWLRHFAGRAVIINGDKPLVRKAADGRYWAYGTPWCGKEGKQVNRRSPLSAICFLEQASINRIAPADTADTATRLLEGTILPATAENQDRMAALVGATVRDVPAFVLRCRPDTEAVELAYVTLSQA